MIEDLAVKLKELPPFAEIEKSGSALFSDPCTEHSCAGIQIRL
jgi:hypothetical protein